MFKPIEGPGYLKAGFLGFPKSGKTYTATELAIGTRRALEQSGPIAIYDTEGGAGYLAARVKQETGQALLTIQARSLSDLIQATLHAEKEKISVLIVDSITHVWRELCDSALREINDRLSAQGKSRRVNLEMRDWSAIKSTWAKWTDLYLNSALSIIICGRAGFEWDQEVDPETGKKQLIKTGVKMKVESEFGFEPSLLVEMERIENEASGDVRYLHQATVIGDRFGLIDGRSATDPKFDFFAPHVIALKGGLHSRIDTSSKTAVGLDQDGNDGWGREKRQRQIFSEEIQAELLKRWPGRTNDEQKQKAALLEETFGTASWTKISEATESAALKRGLDKIRSQQQQPTEKGKK